MEERPVLKSTVLHSQEAEEGAWSLLTRLENNELRMDLRVNGYKPVTASIDEQDLASYACFLKSLKGYTVMKNISIWEQTEPLPEIMMGE